MRDAKIAIVGLGYVGFPLAMLFSKKYDTVGFDSNEQKVNKLRSGIDGGGEIDHDVITEALTSGRLSLTADVNDISSCNFYVVAVPTPVGGDNHADLSPLEGASRTVGQVLKKGDIVVYESTVYPGLTEEFCVPILEKVSGMVYNRDFFVGYSPERINPGDKAHRVNTIRKVTSGSTPEIADYVDHVYGSVVDAGTFKASSIKVAEASKIMENCERDVLIAFFNEMLLVMRQLGININEVREAASTKWNFVNLSPGLVGGHCIAVDPYYLIERAHQVGINPKLLTAAREVNEHMAHDLSQRTIEQMYAHGKNVDDARVLVLGFAFKPDCNDSRNTKVAQLAEDLARKVKQVTIYDPLVDPLKVKAEYGMDVVTEFETISRNVYDAIVIGTNHSCFKNLPLLSLLTENGFVKTLV